MGAILFLISIFSLHDFDINSYLSFSSKNKEPGIEVEFTAVPHLSVGDPVLFKGQQVGSVSKVDIPYSQSEEYHLVRSKVSIKFQDYSLPPSEQLVALVAKVKMPTPKSKNPAVRSVLELIQLSNDLPRNSSGSAKKMIGFTSFEEFWHSNSKS